MMECRECHAEKTLAEFCRRKIGPQKYTHRQPCLTCKRASSQQWRHTHPEYQKKYRQGNREGLLAKKKQYNQGHAEERRVYQGRYNQTHREEQRASMKHHYQAHAEEIRARVKKYRHASPEKVRASAQRYRKANRDKRWAHEAKRRAAQANAPVNDFTSTQWQAMQDHYDHRCVYCSKRCKGKLTQDHLEPLSKGGSHTACNIVPACRSCNSRKKAGPVLVPVQPLLLLHAGREGKYASL